MEFHTCDAFDAVPGVAVVQYTHAGPENCEIILSGDWSVALAPQIFEFIAAVWAGLSLSARTVQTDIWSLDGSSKRVHDPKRRI